MEGRDNKGRFTEKNIWAFIPKDVGRTRIYDNPNELCEKALEYFEWCNEVRKGKYTMAGLRIYLNLSRKNWHDYKQYPNFVTIIEYLESIMEDEMEQKLMWAGSTQGAIFKLKNLYGWKEESTHNQIVTEIKADFGNTTIHPSSQSADNT